MIGYSWVLTFALLLPVLAVAGLIGVLSGYLTLRLIKFPVHRLWIDAIIGASIFFVTIVACILLPYRITYTLSPGVRVSSPIDQYLDPAGLGFIFSGIFPIFYELARFLRSRLARTNHTRPRY